MGYLTKDDILGAADISTTTVEVPEWGGSVLVRPLTGEERDAFEESMLSGQGKNRKVTLANVRAKLVARCVVDESGDRLFSDGDIARLGKKSAAALNRVYEAASKASGLSEADVEELAGNSSSTDGAGSSST